MGEGSFAAVDGVCLGRLVIFAGKILPNFVLAFHLTPIIIDQLVKCNEAIQECCRLSEPFGINRNEEQQQFYMYLKTQILHQNRKFDPKKKRASPIRRQYQIQYRVIEKNISSALATKTIHQIKPKTILFTSQHSPLHPQIDCEFLPTVTSRQSSPTEKHSTIREKLPGEHGKSPRPKVRCQSAFSRFQALKNASQERKAEKVLNTLGVMLQEGGQRGEKVYTLNLLRIHGSSEKKIRINNYFD